MNIFFYCFKKLSDYFLWVSPRSWQKWLHFLCSSWGALGTVWCLFWLCGPSRHIKARTAIARSCCCVLLIFPVYRNFLIGQVRFDLLPILLFKIAAKQYKNTWHFLLFLWDNTYAFHVVAYDKFPILSYFSVSINWRSFRLLKIKIVFIWIIVHTWPLD